MATFILVHGAYHGAWCWERLTPALEARGHTVVAPDLPGHGDDPGGLAAQTMENYVARIVGLIDAAGEPPVVVGHSLAGAVVAAACEARPKDIRRAVFVAAYIPKKKQSVADLAREDTASAISVETGETDGLKTLTLSPAVLADAFYQDAGPDDIAWAAARAEAQSVEPFRAVAKLTKKAFGRVKKSAVLTRRDRAISVGLQQRMAAEAGCEPVYMLPSGHSPFVTAIEPLANILDQSAARKSR